MTIIGKETELRKDCINAIKAHFEEVTSFEELEELERSIDAELEEIRKEQAKQKDQIAKLRVSRWETFYDSLMSHVAGNLMLEIGYVELPNVSRLVGKNLVGFCLGNDRKSVGFYYCEHCHLSDTEFYNCCPLQKIASIQRDTPYAEDELSDGYAKDLLTEIVVNWSKYVTILEANMKNAVMARIISKVDGYIQKQSSLDKELAMFSNDSRQEDSTMDSASSLQSLKGYERYQLQWMIDHGHSLGELMAELTALQYADPEDSAAISEPVSSQFKTWENDRGFGGEIWACEAEYEECDKPML